MSSPSHTPADAPPRGRIRFPLGKALLLMALWLVLSGHRDPFHLSLGVASVAFVLWINRPIRRVPLALPCRPQPPPIRLWRLLTYLPWLFGQMLASGLYVAYLSLRPGPAMRPLLVRFQSRLPSLSAQVVLGNSITLTPGTLTVEIEEDRFTVHALSERTADGLLDGRMARRVARLFGAPPGPAIAEVRKIRTREELARP